MKNKIKEINKLINESEKIIESLVINQIESDDNFKKIFVNVDNSIESKKLDLNYTLKKINKNKYKTIITDNDNESLNLLKLSDVGSALTNLPPKGIFSKLKKNIVKDLKNNFKDIKII